MTTSTTAARSQWDLRPSLRRPAKVLAAGLAAMAGVSLLWSSGASADQVRAADNLPRAIITGDGLPVELVPGQTYTAQVDVLFHAWPAADDLGRSAGVGVLLVDAAGAYLCSSAVVMETDPAAVSVPCEFTAPLTGEFSVKVIAHSADYQDLPDGASAGVRQVAQFPHTVAAAPATS